MAVFDGGSGNDNYVGKADDDVIVGNGGNDILSGSGSADLIYGHGCPDGTLVDLALKATVLNFDIKNAVFQNAENAAQAIYGNVATGADGHLPSLSPNFSQDQIRTCRSILPRALAVSSV